MTLPTRSLTAPRASQYLIRVIGTNEPDARHRWLSRSYSLSRSDPRVLAESRSITARRTSKTPSRIRTRYSAHGDGRQHYT
ncbi:hypothetical protein AcV7_004023 [Taiwanofungus camphoratus]|nr:hypothetical protein AcV7_004023 [Antrodia cinnamomea]